MSDTDTAPDETTLPPLLTSISEKLADLMQHACEHSYRDGQSSQPPSADPPECVVEHLREVSIALYEVSAPERRHSFIVLPRDLPAFLREKIEALLVGMVTDAHKPGR